MSAVKGSFLKKFLRIVVLLNLSLFFLIWAVLAEFFHFPTISFPFEAVSVLGGAFVLLELWNMVSLYQKGRYTFICSPIFWLFCFIKLAGTVSLEQNFLIMFFEFMLVLKVIQIFEIGFCRRTNRIDTEDYFSKYVEYYLAAPILVDIYAFHLLFFSS